MRPDAIVISPGPCDPDQAGISLELVRAAAGRLPDPRRLPRPSGDRPGVRRPHRARADRSCTASSAPSSTQGRGHVSGACRRPFAATRYHSLVAEPDSLPACLEVTARTADGVIMALEHKELPVYGVQFHPESIETEHGHQLLRNFLERVPARGDRMSTAPEPDEGADRPGRGRPRRCASTRRATRSTS